MSVERRKIRGRGAVAALAFGAALWGAAAPATAQAEADQVTVRGRIVDAAGEGVGGQVVRLLKSRTYLTIGGLRSLEQSVDEARATTDSLGFFELLTRRDPAFPYAFLRFYDPKTFDSVKYRLPEDQDISKKVRSGRPVQVTLALAFHPDWLQVEKLLETYAPGSQPGQVLRSLGLPSRREPGGPGRELWTYDQARVAYVIEGAKVIETRRLPGGAESVAETSSRDVPTPAVRVDAP